MSVFTTASASLQGGREEPADVERYITASESLLRLPPFAVQESSTVNKRDVENVRRAMQAQQGMRHGSPTTLGRLPPPMTTGGVGVSFYAEKQNPGFIGVPEKQNPGFIGNIANQYLAAMGNMSAEPPSPLPDRSFLIDRSGGEGLCKPAAKMHPGQEATTGPRRPEAISPRPYSSPQVAPGRMTTAAGGFVPPPVPPVFCSGALASKARGRVPANPANDLLRARSGSPLVASRAPGVSSSAPQSLAASASAALCSPSPQNITAAAASTSTRPSPAHVSRMMSPLRTASPRALQREGSAVMPMSPTITVATSPREGSALKPATISPLQREGSAMLSTVPAPLQREGSAVLQSPTAPSRQGSAVLPVILATSPRPQRQGSALLPLATPQPLQREGSAPLPQGPQRQGSALLPIAAPAQPQRQGSALLPISVPQQPSSVVSPTVALTSTARPQAAPAAASPRIGAFALQKPSPGGDSQLSLLQPTPKPSPRTDSPLTRTCADFRHTRSESADPKPTRTGSEPLLPQESRWKTSRYSSVQRIESPLQFKRRSSLPPRLKTHTGIVRNLSATPSIPTRSLSQAAAVPGSPRRRLSRKVSRLSTSEAVQKSDLDDLSSLLQLSHSTVQIATLEQTRGSSIEASPLNRTASPLNQRYASGQVTTAPTTMLQGNVMSSPLLTGSAPSTPLLAPSTPLLVAMPSMQQLSYSSMPQLSLTRQSSPGSAAAWKNIDGSSIRSDPGHVLGSPMSSCTNTPRVIGQGILLSGVTGSSATASSAGGSVTLTPGTLTPRGPGSYTPTAAIVRTAPKVPALQTLPRLVSGVQWAEGAAAGVRLPETIIMTAAMPDLGLTHNMSPRSTQESEGRPEVTPEPVQEQLHRDIRNPSLQRRWQMEKDSLQSSRAGAADSSHHAETSGALKSTASRQIGTSSTESSPQQQHRSLNPDAEAGVDWQLLIAAELNRQRAEEGAGEGVNVKPQTVSAVAYEYMSKVPQTVSAAPSTVQTAKIPQTVARSSAGPPVSRLHSPPPQISSQSRSSAERSPPPVIARAAASPLQSRSLPRTSAVVFAGSPVPQSWQV